MVAMSPEDSMTTKRPSPLMPLAKEWRATGPGTGVGEGVAAGVGVGEAAGTGGMVVEVICRTNESGVGLMVCACARAAMPSRMTRSAERAAAARDRRKACFTKNPPNGIR